MKVSAENVPARLEQATRSGLDVAPFLCMKPIKLVIADVDGTLVTRKKILTPEALRAIDRLGAAGILFTITSGRPPRGMAMLAERLKLKVPIAAFNGGMIVESDLMTVVRQLPIPLGVASEIVTLSSGAENRRLGLSWERLVPSEEGCTSCRLRAI